WILPRSPLTGVGVAVAVRTPVIPKVAVRSGAIVRLDVGTIATKITVDKRVSQSWRNNCGGENPCQDHFTKHTCFLHTPSFLCVNLLVSWASPIERLLP